MCWHTVRDMTSARFVLVSLLGALLVPYAASAATYGDIGHDISFPGSGSMAAMQNLGNGNFTHGAAVTGMDVRISTAAGQMIKAFIVEYAIDGGQTAQYGPVDYVTTVDGEQVYHFELPAPFTPRADRCYNLLFYQFLDPSGTTFYGWSNEKYVASHAGCAFGRNSDDVAYLNQNPSLNYPGLVDYSFVIHDDGFIPPPQEPVVPLGKTYGSLDADFTFGAQGTMAAVQNLGNGTFSEGNTVTGVDVRVAAVPGNIIKASVREFDSVGNQLNEYFPPDYLPTVEGDHVYNFDFSTTFTPDPSHCYQLYSYQANLSPYSSTYYGHSNDVYVASSTGCVFGQNNDDRAHLTQNPSLNADGYIDYAFRIHTNGATSTPPATTTPACTENCYSNVLFLPGIKASRLYHPRGPSCAVGDCEDQVWIPNANSDVEDMFLNPDGTSVRRDIYTKDILDKYPGGDVYDSFSKFMNQMVASSTINKWDSVPYDWRLDLEHVVNNGTSIDGHISYVDNATSSYVINKLVQLAESSKTEKVTIVAHSNGGLFAKVLMKKLDEMGKGDLVDKVVFVGVPQLGTPKAIATFLHGYDESILRGAVLNEATARTFAENAAGAYTLLPSNAYVAKVSTPTVEFSSTSTAAQTLFSQYGASIQSYQTLRAFLLGFDGRQKPATSDVDSPNILNFELLNRAEQLHSELDSWTPPAGVKLYEVAGVGLETPSGIKYIDSCKFHCMFGGPSLSYEPSVVFEGDGTVVEASAHSGDGDQYYFNINRYNDTNGDLPSVEHGTIMSPHAVLDFVDWVIRNEPIRPLSNTISPTAPSFAGQKRIALRIHSPVSLDLYDGQGRHTGVVHAALPDGTPIRYVENNIPGAHYDEFGEVKYAFTDGSIPVHVVLDGQASGFVTYDIDEMVGNDVITTTSFVNIPVATSSVITMDITDNISTASDLHIDEDGDGHAEAILEPGGIVLFDVTAPTTIASTTGPLGAHNWYLGTTTVQLSATDNDGGSGVSGTVFSLDGSPLQTYSSPIVVTTEGLHTLQYYSIDNSDNREATSTLAIKIDSTAPEAKLSVSISTKDLLVVGAGGMGTTTVTKDVNGNYTVTDDAGHSTKLFFTKTYSGKILTYAKLTAVQYDNAAKLTLPSSSFLYAWDSTSALLSQTIAADKTYAIQALFDKKKNKTTVVLLKKGLSIQTQVFTGLRIVKLTTAKGVVGYEI